MPVTTSKYDYIIAGGGCSGLSMAMHLLHAGLLKDKQVLIIDKDDKVRNDRTWCFWEKEKGLFEPIVHKAWKQLLFRSPGFIKSLDIEPYTYKLIRGIDFYNYCIDILKQQPGVRFLKGDVKSMRNNNDDVVVTVDDHTFESPWVFNSIFQKPLLKKNEYFLLQHFKGWYVETKEDTFAPEQATIMDFNTHQKHGCSFFYVLPFTKRTALIEYTLFSPSLLDDAVYKDALEDYIEKLTNGDYQVLEEENGNIPMTNHLFNKSDGRIINLGTAGGYTKGSSGYTFHFIQKSSAWMVKNMVAGDHPLKGMPADKRFRFYDSVLLRILQEDTVPGSYVFEQLFKKNRASDVFSFLDNESSIMTDLKIISSLPILPFSKSAIKHLSA